MSTLPSTTSSTASLPHPFFLERNPLRPSSSARLRTVGGNVLEEDEGEPRWPARRRNSARPHAQAEQLNTAVGQPGLRRLSDSVQIEKLPPNVSRSRRRNAPSPDPPSRIAAHATLGLRHVPGSTSLTEAAGKKPGVTTAAATAGSNGSGLAYSILCSTIDESPLALDLASARDLAARVSAQVDNDGSPDVNVRSPASVLSRPEPTPTQLTMPYSCETENGDHSSTPRKQRSGSARRYSPRLRSALRLPLTPTALPSVVSTCATLLYSDGSSSSVHRRQRSFAPSAADSPMRQTSQPSVATTNVFHVSSSHSQQEHHGASPMTSPCETAERHREVPLARLTSSSPPPVLGSSTDDAAAPPFSAEAAAAAAAADSVRNSSTSSATVTASPSAVVAPHYRYATRVSTPASLPWPEMNGRYSATAPFPAATQASAAHRHRRFDANGDDDGDGGRVWHEDDVVVVDAADSETAHPATGRGVTSARESVSGVAGAPSAADDVGELLRSYSPQSPPPLPPLGAGYNVAPGDFSPAVAPDHVRESKYVFYPFPTPSSNPLSRSEPCPPPPAAPQVRESPASTGASGSAQPASPHTALERYVLQMAEPSPGFSFVRRLLLIAAVFCAVPFCLSVLLLGLHTWAVEVQEQGYPTPAARPHVGSMLTSRFTLLLGVLLCAVVMGGGGGLAVYALLYRHALRYQQRAFALCRRICQPDSSVGGRGGEEAAAATAELRDDTGRWGSFSPMYAAAKPADAREASSYPLLGRLRRLFALPVVGQRGHREVSALVTALLTPFDADRDTFLMRAFPPSSLSFPSHVRELAGAPEGQAALPSHRNAAAAHTAFGGDAGPHSPPGRCGAGPAMWERGDGAVGSSHGDSSSSGPVADAVLTRRPAHPVDRSRLQEAVTVVVCRFIVPRSLLVLQHPMPKRRVTALETLAREFHTRLRDAACGYEAYVTACSLSEVVFSINTVLPVPSLVATSTATGLALAVQAELAQWSPTYHGRRVQCGVAVHRFGSVLRPTRTTEGRLSLSFGTHEYDVARRLAQLAALCNHGVLCHADFFAEAMNDVQGLPVDFVMDQAQRSFLVYQLHATSVAEDAKKHMADALLLMRHGQYETAAQLLKQWGKSASPAEAFPPAALHLLYVTHVLAEAVRNGAATSPGPPQQQEQQQQQHIAQVRLRGFSEWATWSLAQSYCRPPPVWEEDTDAAFGPLRLGASPASTPTVGDRVGGLARQGATPNASGALVSECSVPPYQAPPVLHERASNSISTTLQNSFGTSFLNRVVPGFCWSASPPPLPSLLQHSELQVTDPGSRPPASANAASLLSAGPDAPMSPGLALAAADARRRRSTSFALSSLSPSSMTSPRPAGVAAQPDALASSPSAMAVSSFLHAMGSTATVRLPQAICDAERQAAKQTKDNLSGSDHTTQQHEQQQAADGPRTEVYTNPLSPTTNPLVPGGGASFAMQITEVRRAQRSAATSPSAPQPHRTYSGELPAEALPDTVLSATRRSGHSRSVRRRRSSPGSRGSRSRGRSCSFLFDDDSTWSENGQTHGSAVAATAAESMVRAPQALTSPTAGRAVADGASHIPLSALSTSSLRLSSGAARRAGVVLTKEPLFSKSSVALSGLGSDGGDDDEFRDSDSECGSCGVTSHEQLPGSVMRRSRSIVSGQEATAAAAVPVVCAITRCIFMSAKGTTRVYQGFHPSGYLVAVKQVEKSATKEVDLLRHEIHLLRGLDDPHIAHYAGSWEDDAALHLVMEYASETLSSVLSKFTRLLPGAARHYIRGVLLALAYLHDTRAIVHRDVSPNNIIISNASGTSEAKLIDFGRSIVLPRSRASTVAASTSNRFDSQSVVEARSTPSSQSSRQVYASVVGTPMFMSPQACQGIVHRSNDVWSVGIILYLCLTGAYPYRHDATVDPDAFVDDVASGHLVPQLSALSEGMEVERSFIEECLSPDYTQRPSAAALLSHQFMTV